MQSTSRAAARAPRSAAYGRSLPWRAALILCAASPSATVCAAPGQTLTFYTDKALFTAAAPNLDTETFEKGRVAGDTHYSFCHDPYDITTADACWSPGDIVYGLSIGSSDANGTLILGANFYGNPTIVTSAGNTPTAATEVGFTVGTLASGMNLFSDSGSHPVSISVYGSGDTLLGGTTATSSFSGSFFGVVSSSRISRIEVSSATAVFLDDVELEHTPNADLSVDLTGVESPPGTLTYTLVLQNAGPDAATGVVATLPISSALTYVSNDCGGSNAASFTWPAGTIAKDTQKICHITTTTAKSQTIIATARVSANEIDTVAANNVSSATDTVAIGLETPDTGFSLFRSFYDLQFRDQAGAPFSLRAKKDKVILVQVCATWCNACFAWSNLGTALQQAVDQAIGAGHFLDVDMLVDGVTAGQPSGQKNANAWKNQTQVPGPVLHSEGTSKSPLFEMGLALQAQYAPVPVEWGYPEFFILAPGCDNQIAVRATPGSTALGEQRIVDTSTIDEMAALITQVWNEPPCVKPLVHRIDRCNIGSATVFASQDSPTVLEAAEPFTVASGQQPVIGSLTAVTDAASLDFTVYADAAGAPGNAVCASPGRPTQSVFASGVQRIELDTACKLGPGNYWVGLTGRTAVAGIAATWHGGYLPPDGSYMYRDPSNVLGQGCTNWSPAGQCVNGEASTQLCYLLDNDAVYRNGFE